MEKRGLPLLLAAVAVAIPAMLWAQEAGYPIIVIPTGKGSYTFPAGYQTPWDKIEIRVTEKMLPNLFVLHGSQALDQAHPDASGGRALVLFGPDGVLMVDTQNRQVQEKTLAAIRSFTQAPIKIVVNSHIHSDHTGANAFFAKRGGLIIPANLSLSSALFGVATADQSGIAGQVQGVTSGDYRVIQFALKWVF